MNISKIQKIPLTPEKHFSIPIPIERAAARTSSGKRSALSRRMKLETFAQKNLELLTSNSNPFIERRAVIDLGSGGTKVCIAEVNTITNQIVEILYQTSFSVKYQAALEESSDQICSDKIQEEGLGIFRQISDLMKEYGVKSNCAVATEAFRKSNNGSEFAERIFAETGIPIRIIPQEEEGILAFYSDLANNPELSPDEILSWDIGTESFQLTVPGEEMSVFMGNVGSIPFRNFILETVQWKEWSDTSYINPMTEKEYLQAYSYAQALARKAFPIIKEKIKFFERRVLGIGRLFFNSIKPLAVDGDRITRKDLRSYIRESMGKTPEELFDDPYATVDLSNAILVLGFMKALHIHEVRPLDTTSTVGMLTYPNYWV